MKISIPIKDRYKFYLRKYGVPQLTAWGEHVWPQVKEKFVRDAQTGKVIARTRQVKYLGRSEDGLLHYYLSDKSKLKNGNRAIPSFMG